MSPYQIPDDMNEIVEEMGKPLGELFEELKDLKIDEQMITDLDDLMFKETKWM